MQRSSVPEQLTVFEQLFPSQEKHCFPLGMLEDSKGGKQVSFYFIFLYKISTETTLFLQLHSIIQSILFSD